MVTEYAVQYRSYEGGKFDRTVPINSRTGFPYTKEQAEEQVEKFNKGKEAITPARVATREATPWRPA
jgi:hypothetical protein